MRSFAKIAKNTMRRWENNSHAESRLVGPFSRDEINDMLSLSKRDANGSEIESIASVVTGLVRAEIERGSLTRSQKPRLVAHDDAETDAYVDDQI